MGTRRKARKVATTRKPVKRRVRSLARESAECIAVAHRLRALAPELKEADPTNPGIVAIEALRDTTVTELSRIRQLIELELRRASHLTKAERGAIEGHLQIVGMVEAAFIGEGQETEH